MSEQRAQRRLAAILAADIVGYSRLMEADEAGTLARVKALRAELLHPKVAAYGGRIVKTTGDGTLIEFPSAVDAVQHAVEVQRDMARRNSAEPDGRRIELRMGINLGDIIIDGDDIYGDGVNVAARLEGLADPGSICISGTVYEHVRGKFDAEFDDLGAQTLKNITKPVQVYRVVLGPTGTKAAPALALPNKPSIAVLPFQNMSGDPEQEYFADGMVDDIITGLSRIKWLFVIARNSSFIYKGKPVDVRQVGRELGVRYVVEGGVRKAGNRVRITAQLLEAETGAHLWADRYDGALEDVFDLQDQITEQVVGIVEPSLRKSEIERSRRKHPENLDAYDLYLRALAMNVMTVDGARIAAGLLEDALKLDPNYAAAHALLSWCHETCFMHDGFDEAERTVGVQHARAAIESGTDDATALAHAAQVISLLGKDRKSALIAIERALSLNASSAMAHIWAAHIHGLGGNPAAAIAHANRALRLSPFDPLTYVIYLALGMTAVQEGHYEEAASHFGKGMQANSSNPSFYFFQASALALAGHMEEAEPIVRRGLKLEPSWRIRVFSAVGFAKPIADKLTEGARLLGLPE